MDLSNFNPVNLILFFTALAIIPFVVIMMTSFVKLVVVLFLLRNALGVQQAPPNIALNGLALILTCYIMAPVMHETYQAFLEKPLDLKEPGSFQELVVRVEKPFQGFLYEHSASRHRRFFVRTAKRIWPPQSALSVQETDLLVLIPAFAVSEFASAFEIGFLLYLPFLAIDLVVSNILLAMGMVMVSPMTISLPFKLFLFVMIDGWTKLIQGLVLSYQ